MSVPAAPRLDAQIEVDRRSMTVEARLEVAGGERVALFGASGAGKTTILEAIAGLVRLRAGSVKVDGELVSAAGRQGPVLAPRHRGIALVRQPTSLFPHLTVEQNIAYGVRGTAAPPAALIERLGLGSLRSARPSALSGGQRQRVALGRALAGDFRVLLLDEPLSAIDAATRPGLRDLALEIVGERAAGAIVVTHDLPEAQAYGTHLGIVEEGRILQLDRAELLVSRPASRRVAELVGYSGFVPAPAEAGTLFAIHPDRVLPGAEPGRGVVLSGIVVAVRAHGARSECELALEEGSRISVRLEAAPAPGSRLTVTAIDPPVVAA